MRYLVTVSIFPYSDIMNLGYTYYQYENWYIGYLNDYPDYQTQGETRAELEEMLAGLYEDISSGTIPFIRHQGQLQISA
jgi:hypothetical protein